MCNAVYKDAYCEIEPPYENSSCANFIKLKNSVTKASKLMVKDLRTIIGILKNEFSILRKNWLML